MPTIVVTVLALLWAAATFACYRRPGQRHVDLRYDLLAVGGYGLLVVAFFWQVLFLPNVWLPSDGGDLASFLYPVYSFAARSVQDGVLPLWNPHLYGGSPFAADMQTGLFYPFNLLAFVIARPFTYQSIEGLAIVHYFLAACFAYVYARGLSLRHVPSFATGVVFAFCGFMVAHLGHLNMLAAAVWLPLILFFFHRALVRGSLASAVYAGAFFGVSALAGHVQVTLYIGLFLLIYWLYYHLNALGRRTLGPTRARDARTFGTPLASSTIARLVALPVSGALAIGLAAVQLMPSYELTRLSVRAEMSFEAASEFRSTPLNLITMIVPHSFGSNVASAWGTQWGLTETYAYVGLLTLALAALALIFTRRTRPLSRFFLLAGILFLLLSFGEQTPLYGWVYKFVPGFDKVRAPGRFALLFDFSLAVMAGVGLQALTGKLPALWRRVYGRFTLIVGLMLGAGIFLVAPFFYHALFTSQDKDPIIFNRIQMAVDSLNLTLLLLAITLILLLAIRYRPNQRRLIGYFMVIVMVIDLFAANQGINPGDQDVTVGFEHPEIASFLRREAAGYRIDTATDIGGIWQPSTALMYGFDDVVGIYNPMLLADYRVYWESLGSRSVPAYDLMSARYVIAKKDVTLDWTKFRPALTDAPELNVYENTRAMPRAALVPRAEIVARDKMLDRLKSPDFDPRRVVLLENGSPLVSADSPAPGEVKSADYADPNEVTLEVETGQPAYLVLSDVYYPGWRCLIDGSETPILRANYLFRAVQVPPGAHTIRFFFWPRPLLIGGLVSGLTLILILAVTMVSTRGQRLVRATSERAQDALS